MNSYLEKGVENRKVPKEDKAKWNNVAMLFFWFFRTAAGGENSSHRQSHAIVPGWFAELLTERPMTQWKIRFSSLYTAGRTHFLPEKDLAVVKEGNSFIVYGK